MATGRPNILYVMVDQQRFDTIAALGNPIICTPNLDRLVRRGVTFTRAYSSCPVCVAARYNIRTGCEPPRTASYANGRTVPVPQQEQDMEKRCGPFLGRRMGQLGYRTFGIGKFHSTEHSDLGFQTCLGSEELHPTPQRRQEDAYLSFIAREHPQFDYIEQPHGERTDMYYMPQAAPVPAELTQEAWAADQAIKQIEAFDGRPWFGFISFIGPHPPFAPPLPYNRMYDPDRMPNPVLGKLDIDHMDEYIPWMNYLIWADDISTTRARSLKARYYGKITHIDHCIGRMLDAVEARGDAENTVIAFFTDHGDMMGDHHAWQKECYFEAACHIPFLLSWPARLADDQRRDDLVSLTDLFGIATAAAGQTETRDGIDVLGMLDGKVSPRDYYVGYYATPGTAQFKCMVRQGDWKYIFIANGGREQLFNLADDPNELANLADSRPDAMALLRRIAVETINQPNADRAMDGGRLRAFPFSPRPLRRIYQFDQSRGVTGFPAHPADALRTYQRLAR